MTRECGRGIRPRRALVTTGFFLIHGAGTVLLGIPLALREIAPNAMYGVRIPVTFGDPRVWYVVNRVAGIALIASGAGIAVGALLLYVARNRLRKRRIELLRANIVLSAALLAIATLAWVGAVWR